MAVRRERARFWDGFVIGERCLRCQESAFPPDRVVACAGALLERVVRCNTCAAIFVHPPGNGTGHLNRHFDDHRARGDQPRMAAFVQIAAPAPVLRPLAMPQIPFEALGIEIGELRFIDEFVAFKRRNFAFNNLVIQYVTNTINRHDSTPDELDDFCRGWAERVRIGDEEALFLNQCRRTWLYFFYQLVNYCHTILSTPEFNFRAETQTLLQYCLPLEKANALYNLRIPWYCQNGPENADLHLYLVQNNCEPSMNKRLRFLIECYGLHEFDPYFIPSVPEHMGQLDNFFRLN